MKISFTEYKEFDPKDERKRIKRLWSAEKDHTTIDFLYRMADAIEAEKMDTVIDIYGEACKIRDQEQGCPIAEFFPIFVSDLVEAWRCGKTIDFHEKEG